MKTSLTAGVAALVLTTGALLAAPPANADDASAGVPVMKIWVQGDQAMTSAATITPGIIQFEVGDTFVVPGDNGGPDTLTVFSSDNPDLAEAQMPAIIAGNPGDPASLAAGAQAIRTLHGLTTIYGGGQKGTTWQVRLNPGTYYVFGPNSSALHLAKRAQFTVEGTPHPGALHSTSAVVQARGPVGHNKWVTAGLGSIGDGWLRFSNRSRELHFLNMSGVKPGTTPAMVRKALASPENPTFFTNQAFDFDVISPGVTVAIKGPIKEGEYLLACFMPSEADGMPHAFMGMWKLVEVG